MQKHTYFEIKLRVECNEESGKERLKRFIIESFMYLVKFYPTFKIVYIEELSCDEYDTRNQNDKPYK